MNEANTNTVFLIDTDPVARETIQELASAMKFEVEFHDNAESFLQSYMAQRGGCVISEFRLFGMNGIALQEAMLAAGYRMPIIFVTRFAETPLTVRAIKAGAITVLEKPFSRQDLWDALQNAIVVADQIRRIDAQHTTVRRRLSRFTPKERQVLELIMAGKPNKEIAATLAVSVRTVETRRHQIFKKSGTESVAELVKVVLETNGLGAAKEDGSGILE